MTNECEIKKISDEEITVTFKKSELFQLNLCILTRSAAVAIKLNNTTSSDERNALQDTIQYLTNLSEKIERILKSNGKLN